MSNETKEAHAAATGAGSKSVLIIYYSLTGNTKSIAEKIREKTRGDVFEIETVRTYPTERPASIEEAKKGVGDRRIASIEEKSARYVIV